MNQDLESLKKEIETPKRKLSFEDSTDEEQLAKEIEKGYKECWTSSVGLRNRKNANRDRKSYIRERETKNC